MSTDRSRSVAVITSPCHGEDRGFDSRRDRMNTYSVFITNLKSIGPVAQLVEQWIEAPCVGGSIPSRAINLIFWRDSEEAKRGGL